MSSTQEQGKEAIDFRNAASAVARSYGFSLAIKGDDDPNSYKVAISSIDHDRWMVAMVEEMESLRKNKIWELMELPKGSKLVGCKWAFKIKKGQKFKARLVGKHYSHKEGIDYNKILSPTTFLHGYLEDTMYMQQPEGFMEPGKEGWVCKLKRSLYDLEKSPRQWYKRFDGFMVSHGYLRCEHDYYSFCDDGSIVLLSLYEDDMLIAMKEKKHIVMLKKMLSKEFDMKDLDAAKKILMICHCVVNYEGGWCLTEVGKEASCVKGMVEQFGYKQEAWSKFTLRRMERICLPKSLQLSSSSIAWTLSMSPLVEFVVKHSLPLEKYMHVHAGLRVMRTCECVYDKELLEYRGTTLALMVHWGMARELMMH
ncbi:Retrovirus-related Pol polyprotein from transposon TNT 1-94-like protein [Drosera capensis]